MVDYCTLKVKILTHYIIDVVDHCSLKVTILTITNHIGDKDTNHYVTDVVDHCTLKVKILTITSPMWLTTVHSR